MGLLQQPLQPPLGVPVMALFSEFVGQLPEPPWSVLHWASKALPKFTPLPNLLFTKCARVKSKPPEPEEGELAELGLLGPIGPLSLEKPLGPLEQLPK